MTIGNLFTVSAPSGAGKTSLVKALVEQEKNIALSVSHTTRPIRKGEIDGTDYHFVNKEEFQTLVNQGEFLEFAEVFGNFYGTTQSSTDKQLSSGRDVILEIDWQGAAQVRKLRPDCVSIFILPPSRETLEKRLRSRGQDDDTVIARRMQAAKDEMSHYAESDFLVINDDFHQALSELRSIIVSCRVRQVRQERVHADLIRSLLA